VEQESLLQVEQRLQQHLLALQVEILFLVDLLGVLQTALKAVAVQVILQMEVLLAQAMAEMAVQVAVAVVVLDK
jgi:hypothetical protein